MHGDVKKEEEGEKVILPNLAIPKQRTIWKPGGVRGGKGTTWAFKNCLIVIET